MFDLEEWLKHANEQMKKRQAALEQGYNSGASTPSSSSSSSSSFKSNRARRASFPSAGSKGKRGDRRESHAEKPKDAFENLRVSLNFCLACVARRNRPFS
jgi:hypothetical protein